MTICQLILVLAFALGIPCTWADPVPEYDMKAAFLYNFASFTEWPEPIVGNFNLCIFGNDPIGPSLDALEGKLLQGAHLTVVRITADTQARQCHLLYLSDPEHSNTRHMLNGLAELPILTVTGESNQEGPGAMISMTLENRKLTFEVNYEAARRARLSLSSKMLRLAQRVH